MNNSEVLSFTGEVSTTVNLERREHADVRLLITTHVDNNRESEEQRRIRENSRTVYQGIWFFGEATERDL